MNYIYLLTPKEEPKLFGAIKQAIVIAKSKSDAKSIHPGTGWESNIDFPLWAKTPEDVLVSRLGIADPTLVPGVILTSLSNNWIDDGK